MGASNPIAWQPLTPRGVAAFAFAPLRRLLLVQFVVALGVAAGVALLCYDRYVPVIAGAIEKLPAQSQVRWQRLEWHTNSPVMLAENRFLSLSVDLERSGQLRSVAHVQFEFGRSNVVVHSLLGYVAVPYPQGWVMPANRETLQPLWGAWLPGLLAGVIGGVMLWLFASWFALAVLYAGPLWLLGFFINRQLGLRGSLRLSGAALLPGALLMLAGISFYDLGVLDLVGMAFVFAMHLIVGCVYLVLGLIALPRLPAENAVKKNPFTPSDPK